MSELWYWRSNDRIRGPLVTEELEALVFKDRLADGDAVRLDGSDEWLPAREIRGLFLDSAAESPAATAARLLETAAARRLQGNTASHRGSTLGAVAGKVSSGLGEAAGRFLDAAVRSVQVLTGWLGRRGRLLVTALAGLILLGFLVSRVIAWAPGDYSRLRRIEALWKQVDSRAGVSGSLPVEESAELAAIESDLETLLRDQPVSGSSGGARKSALARREMLYAVREIRQSATEPDQDKRDRIDRSLESAHDYLSGARHVTEVRTEAGSPPPAHRSTEIIAIIVIDGVLVCLVAAWWVMGRGRG